MISRKIEKALKIESYRDVSAKTFSFGVSCTEYPQDFQNAAEKLGRIMTGQEGWQGVSTEMVYFSGMANRANKYLAKTATSFRIKEATVYGDGTSRYILK